MAARGACQAQRGAGWEVLAGQSCSPRPGWGPAAGCSLKLSVSCPCRFPAWQPDGPTLPQALAAAAVLRCHRHSPLPAAGSPPLGTGLLELLGPQCWLGGSNGRGVGMLGSWIIVDAGNTLSQQGSPLASLPDPRPPVSQQHTCWWSGVGFPM